MPPIHFRFQVILEQINGSKIGILQATRGLGTYCWGARGKSTEILVPVEPPLFDLKVWLDLPSTGQNPPGSALTPSSILFGSVEMEATDDEFQQIEAREDKDWFRTFGKRFYNLVGPPLKNFVDVLIALSGQYWLRRVRLWDSRRESLGAYFSDAIIMEFSIDGISWENFEPTPRETTLELRAPQDSDFEQYFQESDWQDLKNIMEARYKYSLRDQLITESHEKWDLGEFSEALIWAAMALEVALSSFLETALNGNLSIREKVESILKDKLKISNALVIAMPLLGVPPDTIQLASDGINTRNDIVHRGFHANESHLPQFQAIMSCIQALSPGFEYKFPSISLGNRFSLQ